MVKKFTYRVVCYIDVEAETEEDALQYAEEQFPVEPKEIDLYEVDEICREDYVADSINDERRINEFVDFV